MDKKIMWLEIRHYIWEHPQKWMFKNNWSIQFDEKEYELFPWRASQERINRWQDQLDLLQGVNPWIWQIDGNLLLNINEQRTLQH